MIIAQQKRRENIVEYLLYMWQIEDIIRAYNFDIEKIANQVISYYKQPEEKRNEIRDWYEQLIQMMQQEGVKKSGHIYLIRHLLDELQELHIKLINNNDREYVQLYQKNFDHLQELRKRMKDPNTGDIEAILTSIYGTALLRMQGKQISDDTRQAVKELSVFMDNLAEKYKAYETGKLEID